MTANVRRITFRAVGKYGHGLLHSATARVSLSAHLTLLSRAAPGTPLKAIHNSRLPHALQPSPRSSRRGSRGLGMWTPLESFSNDALAGMLTDVLSLALARDGLVGVVLVGFAWAVALGLLVVSGAAL